MMRRLLIIAMDVNQTAPGVVYGKLLKRLAESFEITLICPDAKRCLDSKINKVEIPPYKRVRHRLEVLFYRYFGCNLSDPIWSRKVQRLESVSNLSNFDAVVSFVSQGQFAPLYLGNVLSKRLETKWLVYSVDAIPTPLDWNPDKKSHRNVSSVLDKLVSNADAFFSANPIMLQYELKTLKSFRGFSSVVLTPFDGQSVLNENTAHDGCTFLYTGNVYGARRITSLLAAFNQFHEQYNNSKLLFIGHGFEEARRDYADLVNSGSIEIHGFTDDLSPYFSKSDVLIDIAADVTNDVFLSSKIANYLPYNKPIIAISGDNSPVRHLMGACNSVIHCHHNVTEIFDAMQIATNYEGTEINDRASLLEMFSLENVSAKFIKEIKMIVGKA